MRVPVPTKAVPRTVTPQTAKCFPFRLMLHLGTLLYFFYKASTDPSPAVCADDPFNTNNGQCSYHTENGELYVTSEAKAEYNVQD